MRSRIVVMLGCNDTGNCRENKLNRSSLSFTEVNQGNTFKVQSQTTKLSGVSQHFSFQHSYMLEWTLLFMVMLLNINPIAPSLSFPHLDHKIVFASAEEKNWVSLHIVSTMWVLGHSILYKIEAQSTWLWTSLRLLLCCFYLALFVQKVIVQEVLPFSYTVQWNDIAGLRKAEVRKVSFAFFSHVQTQLPHDYCLHIFKWEMDVQVR